MPELPEVETVVRSLRPCLEGKTLADAQVLFPGIIRRGLLHFEERIQGKRVREIERRGKYILCTLSSGDTLIFHLGMTGRLFAEKPGAPVSKHTHLILFRKSGPLEIRFEDPRRFGRVLLLTMAERENFPSLSTLGPEPLTISFPRFREDLSRHKRQIKALLLDQHFLAGMGNIYCDETLIRSGIHPLHPSDTLSTEQARQLHDQIRLVLKKAIRAGGSSIRDYVDGLGRPGRFQLQYLAYGRTGQACLQRGCPGTITRIRAAGRSTHFCPKCQRLPSR